MTVVSRRTRKAFGAWCGRCFLFLGIWWALSEGRPTNWGFGLAASALAAAAAIPLRRGGTGPVSPAGLLRFVPFFLWRSFVAAAQVARLALSPRLRLRPAVVTYRPRLSTLAGQVFLANTLSLLPGTLSADLWGEQVRLHVLNAGPRVLEEVAAVERRVGDLLGDPLRGGVDGGL